VPIALVSSDFDGTLVDKSFPDGSRENVRSFTESDLARVINSGANPMKLIHAINQISSRSWNKLLGLFIASGGALLLEPGVKKPIWEVPLTGIEKILEDIALSGVKLNDYIYLLSKEGWVESEKRNLNETYYVVSIRVQTEEEAFEFKNKFASDQLSITLNRDSHGGGTRVQIASSDAGKDKVIEFLRERLGIRNAEIAHLGDDWNDLPAWLLENLLSGVIETAKEELKSSVPEPKVAIAPPREAGVARFLTDLKNENFFQFGERLSEQK
jgi:hydroxymethylpyrimidine pyrophosphatase-like HAD family hydrolase